MKIMKAQRAVFLKVVRNENKELILVDTNGVEFLVPQINEVGTSLYKRAVAAANSPEKYCFKVRVSGTLSEGSVLSLVEFLLINLLVLNLLLTSINQMVVWKHSK
jgi:hypothetical protein